MKNLVKHSWLLIILLFFSSCEDEKWKKTYDIHKVQPFGCELIFNHLTELFPNSTITKNTQKIFNKERHSHLDKTIITPSGFTMPNDWTEDYEEATNQTIKQNNYEANWVLVGTSSFDEQDIYALFHELEEGKKLIIASNNFSVKLLKNTFDISSDKASNNKKQLAVYLNNKEYLLDYIPNYKHIKANNFGKSLLKTKKGHSLIERFTVGTGELIICTEAVLFTNYNLLTRNNRKIMEHCFSGFDDKDIVWFNNYKSSDYSPKTKKKREKSPSYLDFINDNPALQAAFYLLLLGGIIYAMLGIKRKQRLIPLVQLPINTTIKFVTMVGQLYRDNGSHEELATKKIIFFADWLREHFHLHGEVFTQDVFALISERSGVNQTRMTEVLRLIQLIKNSDSITKQTLLDLNERIESLKKIL
jgi:hypothetical protein